MNMKIEIDTKRDSKEDILKIIRMLQSMVREGSPYSSSSSSDSSDSSSPESPVGLGILDLPPSESSSADEKKEEKPRVELY
jgi:hypothetical protein